MTVVLDKDNLAAPSPDHAAMSAYWEQVKSIVGGIKTMREGRTKYLPKFPNESDKDYKFRLETSTMTNVYRDIVEGLASKPFSKEVKAEKAPEEIIENVDGRGNHLGVFLFETFFAGINDAINWIMVDYPKTDPSELRTLAEERAAGVRPYWIHIPASDMLDVRSEIINGIETISYAKIFESNADGDRIRIFERAGGKTTWTLYAENDKKEWEKVDGGIVTINEIPLVPFITGRRLGNSWQFHPAMRDAADLQVEMYQSETALKHARILTAFPMLAANGVQPQYEGTGANRRPRPVPFGPQAVLYAPPNDNGTSGSWERIAADSACLKFLQDNIIETAKQMREIGRQPLTAQSGNVTRISAAFAASKGNTAVQAWALGLKDAAENAFLLTSKWLNKPDEIEVEIFTDFPVETDGNPVPDQLATMRANGDLSQKTYWLELQRHGVLSSNFDPDEEKKALMDEAFNNGNPGEEDIANAM